MADVTINGLTQQTSIDRAADFFEVSDTSDSNNSRKTTVNNMLNITSQPMGLTDTQSPTNKTFDNSNIFTIRDDRLTLQDNADTTKQAVFQLSGITTGTTRTYTLPNVTDTLVSLTATQTLTNKTLTSPTISAPTITNPTLTVDTISEFTAANGVTIDGLNIKDGALNTANSVPNSAIATGVQSSKLSNPYKFSVYRNAAQSSSASAFVKINFDTEEFDTGGNYDNATNFRFTAPVTGFYSFSWQIGFPISAASTDTVSALYKNGTVYKWATESQNNLAGSGNALVSATAGDYFEIFLFATTTSALNVGGAPIKTYFSGFLLSTT